jgi:hypothetical protein
VRRGKKCINDLPTKSSAKLLSILALMRCDIDCCTGGLSCDAPCRDKNTVTVSALHLEASISPATVNPKSAETCKDRLTSEAAAHLSDYWQNPLTVADAVLTPQYSRVWQVAGLGEAAALTCANFQRPEWVQIQSKG